MEYKRSTFQLGLQARNVSKSEKNRTTDGTALFISKPVKWQQHRGNDKRKGKKKRDKRTEE